jgi:hypothetical protein
MRHTDRGNRRPRTFLAGELRWNGAARKGGDLGAGALESIRGKKERQ